MLKHSHFLTNYLKLQILASYKNLRICRSWIWPRALTIQKLTKLLLLACLKRYFLNPILTGRDKCYRRCPSIKKSMSYSSRHIIHSEVFQLDGMSATTAGTMVKSFFSCLIPAKTSVDLQADRRLSINESPMNTNLTFNEFPMVSSWDLLCSQWMLR